MSIIIKHIWRNILSNRIRSFLIIFSLALSSAVFYMNLNISQDVFDSSKIILQGVTKDYDVLVTGDLTENALVLPSCEKLQNFYLEPVLNEEKETLILHCDLKSLEDEEVIRMGQTLADKETAVHPAYMARAVATHRGYGLGDVITVVMENGVRDYTLMGYVESLGVLDLAEDDMLQLLVPLQPGDPVNAVMAALTRDDELAGVIDELDATYEDLNVTALHSTTDKRLNSIRQIMSIILLLVVGISFYVISTTSALIIDYRIPVLGVFRSLGATKRRTNAILLTESAVYGLVASVPGMVLGEVIRNMVRTQSLSVGASSANMKNLLMVPAFAVGMNLAISAFSVFRAGKIPVRELLFRKQSAVKKPSKVLPWVGVAMTIASVVLALLNRKYAFGILVAELVLGLVGLSLIIGGICGLIGEYLSESVQRVFSGSVWLGIRNLGVNKINRSTSLLVATVVAMVVLIYVCVGSISSFFDQYQNNYPYDIMIKGAVSEDGTFDYIENLDGVNDVTYEYWQYTNTVINGEPIRICFAANDGFSNGIDADPWTLDNLNSGTCLMDRLFASMYNYEIGDILTISGEDGEEYQLTIVDWCESNVFNSSRNTVVITREDYFRHVKINPAIIGVYTHWDTATMIASINKAVAAQTGGAFRVRSTADYVDSELGEAMGAVKAVSAVPFLAVTLALFGLVNNQLIAFNQKRMQYAVLYSTAMSRLQLASTMLSELLSSFLVGSVIGAVMSVWLSKVMRDIIFTSFSYVPLVITPGQLGRTFGLVLLMMILTAVFPLRRLKKMDIVKEIKYE